MSSTDLRGDGTKCVDNRPHISRRLVRGLERMGYHGQRQGCVTLVPIQGFFLDRHHLCAGR
jgi:hypothetical protein